MRKELFDELLESVREGGEILRGERSPARQAGRALDHGRGPRLPAEEAEPG